MPDTASDGMVSGPAGGRARNLAIQDAGSLLVRDAVQPDPPAAPHPSHTNRARGQRNAVDGPVNLAGVIQPEVGALSNTEWQIPLNVVPQSMERPFAVDARFLEAVSTIKELLAGFTFAHSRAAAPPPADTVFHIHDDHGDYGGDSDRKDGEDSEDSDDGGGGGEGGGGGGGGGGGSY